jgi:hypothetical protein
MERRAGWDGGEIVMLTPVGKNLSRPWNRRLLVGQKKPLQPEHVLTVGTGRCDHRMAMSSMRHAQERKRHLRTSTGARHTKKTHRIPPIGFNHPGDTDGDRQKK